VWEPSPFAGWAMASGGEGGDPAVASAADAGAHNRGVVANPNPYAAT
jgi:hypothetical protein